MAFQVLFIEVIYTEFSFFILEFNLSYDKNGQQDQNLLMKLSTLTLLSIKNKKLDLL